MEPLVHIKELEEKLRVLESKNTLLEKEQQAAKRLVEKNRLASDKLFQGLFLNIRQACVIFSSLDGGNDFIIRDVNPAFERIEGVKKELVIGTKLSETHQYTPAHIMDVYKRVYKSGKSEEFVFYWEDQDKKKQWRDNDIFKLESGEVIAVYEDITILKEKEAALLKSETKFRSYFKDHKAIKLQIDAETHKIADVNKSAVKFYGYSKEELLEKTIFDLNALPKEEVIESMRKAQRDEQTTFSFPHRIKSGDLRDVQVYTTLMEVEGRKYFFSIVHDVTVRKKAEENLRRSELRFRSFFENNTAAMLQIDPETKQIVEANAAAIRFYGYSREQFKKLKVQDINTLPPNEIDKKMKQVMSSQAQTFIFKHRLSSGENREVEVYVSPVNTGAERQLFVTIYDVSEREENKRVLEESERKLIEAQRIAKIGSWEVYFDSEMMKCSDELNNIYEVSENYQYTTENYNRLIHPEDLPEVKELWKTSLLEKTEYFSTHRIVTPNNKIKYVEEKGYTVFDKKGKPIRSLGTTQDITERKLAEIELQKSRDYLKEAQRIAKIGHFEFNLNTKETDWSDEVSRIFGFEIENKKPTFEKYRKQMHPDDVDNQYAIFSRALKEKRGYTVSYRIMSLSGEEKQIEEKGYFELDKKGNPIKVIGTMQDVTSTVFVKKALEKSKAQLALINQDLEKRVKEELEKSRDKDHLLIQQSRASVLGEMIGNIAHQWRQPLNEVSILINDLEDAYSFGVLNKAYFEKTTEIVYRRLKYMSDTINDFRKMHTDDFKKEIFSPKELIEKLIQFTEGTFKKNKIRMRFMCNDDFEVHGYPNMLSHILLNLLNNSRDILVERSVKRPKIWIKLEKKESNYCIRVLDNGKGVDRAVINKIFDPYFTTKDKKRGSGLGLYMTKSMVEKQMGGEIQVQNQRDGAEFKITLDLKNENL